jgi:hypothetical protein
MVICTWRLRRTWQTEAAGIDLQMDQDADELVKTFGTFDEACRSAFAFKHLADQSKFLDLLQRYDRSLSRQFDRAIARLKELQKDRGGYQRGRNLQNEPNQEHPGPAPANLQNEPRNSSPVSQKVILQNEPKPAEPTHSSANLQNEPTLLCQLIEISRDGEAIALLRPEIERAG